jgi:hypothetical protein
MSDDIVPTRAWPKQPMKAFLLRSALGATMCLAVVQRLSAAFDQEPGSAFAVSLGGLGVAVQGGAQRVFTNPAAVRLSHAEVTFTITPLPFGLPELQRLGIAASIPAGAVQTTVAIERTGFDLYRETTVSIAAGLPVSDMLSLGCAASLYHLAIRRYGTALTIGLHSGVIVGFGANVACGLVIRNWNVPRLGDAGDRLEPEAAFGIAWRPDSPIEVLCDLSHQLGYPSCLHLGTRWTPLDEFELRMGATTDPGSLSAGFGIRMGSLTADYACRYHPVLGDTHLFSITIAFSGP